MIDKNLITFQKADEELLKLFKKFDTDYKGKLPKVAVFKKGIDFYCGHFKFNFNAIFTELDK